MKAKTLRFGTDAKRVNVDLRRGWSARLIVKQAG